MIIGERDDGLSTFYPPVLPFNAPKDHTPGDKTSPWETVTLDQELPNLGMIGVPMKMRMEYGRFMKMGVPHD